MIFIETRPLTESTTNSLNTWQSKIDGLPTYEARVKHGASSFDSKRKTAPFIEIRRVLDEMCQGARRCGYCEDSCADEIEHIRPKSLYPEDVFRWGNYLYACGPCNGGKNNHYAVFSGDVGLEWAVISRSRKDPVIPPKTGAPVFVNPRQDNPLDYIILDLQSSFMFSPFASEGSRDHVRGKYTIDTLRLNREVLRRGRSGAFSAYRRRLEAYIAFARRGASQHERDARKHEFVESPHRTVWLEMQRQVQQFPDSHTELRDLFVEAPEALHW